MSLTGDREAQTQTNFSGEHTNSLRGQNNNDPGKTHTVLHLNIANESDETTDWQQRTRGNRKLNGKGIKSNFVMKQI